MDKLFDRLGFPKAHYQMHLAVVGGLPITLVADLAHELCLPRSQVMRWVGGSFRFPYMSTRASEVLCRLVETLDALLLLYEGNLDAALRWLTSPIKTLAFERPIDLIVTEPGTRAVMQAIHSLEYGLPV